MLTQLIYCSRTTPEFGPEHIASILEASYRNNRPRGLTGFLSFDANHFLQCLEGSRAAVNEIYLKIARDPRHRDVEILGFRSLTRRDFPEWTMGYVPYSEEVRKVVFSVSPVDAFDPYRMDGHHALGFLKTLAEHDRKRGVDSAVPA